jgi:predicted MPP superfamily phosphohydrolase
LHLTAPSLGFGETSSSRPLFRFGIMADLQYADAETKGSRFYRHSLKKLEQSIAHWKKASVAFVVHLGDLIDHGWENYPPVLEKLETLDCPVYHVLGNHDFSVEPSQKSRVPGLLGLETNYYDFLRDSWRFVVLDSTDISPYTGSETEKENNEFHRKSLEAEEHPFHSPYSGALGNRQMAWLKTTLTESDRKQQNVVLLSHMPVYPEMRLNLWNAPELLELFREHPCVKVFLAGHHHAGNFGVLDHVAHLTLPGAVETEEENAYGIVDAYHDRLEIDGFGRLTDYVLR